MSAKYNFKWAKIQNRAYFKNEYQKLMSKEQKELKDLKEFKQKYFCKLKYLVKPLSQSLDKGNNRYIQ